MAAVTSRDATIAKAAEHGPFVSKRPAASERKFVSRSVDAAITRVQQQIGDGELRWMFENCLPNTLDTTVTFEVVAGKPDTFLITGDIDAMWLRDSSAQVWPYLPFAKEDMELRRMLEGLIRRQTACVLIDPYANAFMRSPDAKPLPWAVKDHTEKKLGVGERKWEIDSLCYPIRLAYGYWKATGDVAPFDADWVRATKLIIDTFREQQRKTGVGPYKFQRESTSPTETQFLGGYGNPTRPNGMVHSMFRPSDDACVYPLFVPANLFAAKALRQLAEMGRLVLHDDAFAQQASILAGEIQTAVERDGVVRDAAGDYWAYEIDGFGNQLFMDDANVPSLLGLPYLGCCQADDARYQRTRKRVLSEQNPYFFRGQAAEGTGGPHEGLRMIWPMSILIRALTSTDDAEIRQCLQWIKTTHAGTGFIHESFQQDNPKEFTRTWFAWANSLFGELILQLSANRPYLLR